MKDKLHKNYKIASNLVFVILIMDILELIFYYSDPDRLFFELLGLTFIGFTGYVIRRGINWVKYILLILTLLQAAGIVITFSNVPLLTFFSNLLQAVILMVAVILLFKIPASTDDKALDSDI